MPTDWSFANDVISLGGAGEGRIPAADASRQTATAREIVERLRSQPGVVLADEVGMGKTYVAMAVAASVIVATRGRSGPVVVMVPPGLRRKWQRDWEQFKSHCIRRDALDWVRDEYAHTPTEFFKLLDDDGERRVHLLFVTTGCFHRDLTDPFVKLAMIRLARRYTKLDPERARHLERWAADLVRQSSHLKEPLIQRLMRRDVREWRAILQDATDDPVPSHLVSVADRLDWSPITSFLLTSLPKKRPKAVSKDTRDGTRKEFVSACREIYQRWLRQTEWHSPLLILDEAHHAKNDRTRLARLFRQETEEDVALLKDKFDRMLFLTATPFQLEHRELIRVLKSFGAVRWSGPHAPGTTRADFDSAIRELEKELDDYRVAGRDLDRQWGRLRPDILRNVDSNGDEEQRVLDWWRSTDTAAASELEKLRETYDKCCAKKSRAEKLLRTWIVRHNRLVHLPGTDKARRQVLPGRAIVHPNTVASGQVVEGLAIPERALLPFLLTARAQGYLAQSPGTRAYFAEGLVSSYEAFHDTRKRRSKALDVHDDSEPSLETPIVEWYEGQIARLVPSRNKDRELRISHPKVSATVHRALEIWLGGEKVLVFCFFIETARALAEHLNEKVHTKIVEIAASKMGIESRHELEKRLAGIARRLSDTRSPFHRAIRSLLEGEVAKPQYALLQTYRKQLVEVLMAYFRSPSFVARYLPLENPAVREALGKRTTRPDFVERTVIALQDAIRERTDAAGQTYLDRVTQFLEFASELAERAQRHLKSREGEIVDEADDPLEEYLRAVGTYSRPRDDGDDGSYRARRLVQRVDGGTPPASRDRVMLAFNSPLFPEILVSSSVLGEGVDLHRFCRHVIHHDLCWNPSTLEQRTGRLDRVRCKAEVCRHPIEVYQPFIAGSADEKMFRVVRDRERWFHIVMGAKFEFDEASSEAIADRVPFPRELARDLIFDLSCWSE